MTSGSTRGRPRDAAVDRRILEAVGRTLGEVGYADLSVDQIAVEAGVAKTTVYRRWPTKARLVLAVITAMQSDVPIADTGDVREDLTRLVTMIGIGLNQLGPSLVAALASAAADDPELGSSVHELFGGRRRVAAQLVTTAIERGQLSAGTDSELLLDVIVGPLYYRLLVTGDPITPPYCRALVDAAMPTIPQADKREK